LNFFLGKIFLEKKKLKNLNVIIFSCIQLKNQLKSTKYMRTFFLCEFQGPINFCWFLLFFSAETDLRKWKFPLYESLKDLWRFSWLYVWEEIWPKKKFCYQKHFFAFLNRNRFWRIERQRIFLRFFFFFKKKNFLHNFFKKISKNLNKSNQIKKK